MDLPKNYIKFQPVLIPSVSKDFAAVFNCFFCNLGPWVFHGCFLGFVGMNIILFTGRN